MLFRRALWLLVVVPGVVAVPRTQTLTVGDAAPKVVATSWLNWEGPAPTLESLRGRVVLLEFWGTWCGPCVRAMPGIQKLHDRYGSRGLTVLAISYEPPATLQPFLTNNAFTMPVGSDPDKATIAPYGIRGWPTTIVIDRQGKVAHIGSPYDAEQVVERALGLEAGPGALLTAYLDSLKSPKKPARRESLERLRERAPHDFDLQSWALSHLAPETVPADGAPPPVHERADVADGSADAPDLLRRCAQAWPDASRRAALLQQLGDTGPTHFDLAAFARDTMQSAFPFDAAELKTLLQQKKFASVVEAIAERCPSSPVLSAAAKNKDLATYCKSKVDGARRMAKQGLMAQLWLFPGALPRDQKQNDAFFGELAVSGMATSADKKSITGILLGGEMVQRDHIEHFVQSQLEQTILMADLAASRSPKVGDLAQLVQRERDALVQDLETRYGKPAPQKPR